MITVADVEPKWLRILSKFRRKTTLLDLLVVMLLVSVGVHVLLWYGTKKGWWVFGWL